MGKVKSHVVDGVQRAERLGEVLDADLSHGRTWECHAGQTACEASAAPDDLAAGDVEERQMMREDRQRHLFVQIVTPVVVAVDHRQGDAVGRQVDDVLAAEVLAQHDRRREMEGAASGAVVLAGAVREVDPLRPHADEDVGRRSRSALTSAGNAKSAVVHQVSPSRCSQRAAQEVRRGKADQGHGADVLRLAVERLRRS